MKRAALLILCLAATAFAATAVKWSIAWRYRTGGAISAAPISAQLPLPDPYLITCVASADGFVYGLNVATGKRGWSTKLGSPVETLVRFTHHRLLATTADGRLVCLSTAGKILWQYKTNETLAAGATFLKTMRDERRKLTYPTRIFLTCHGGKIFCISDEGKLFWTAKTSDAINGQAIPISGIGPDLGSIAVGCCDGKVYVFAKKDGKQLAAIDLKDYIPTSPVDDLGHFYVVTAGGELSKIDNDGTKIWTVKPTKAQAAKLGSVFVTPLRIEKRLIVADDKGTLWALDTTNGQVLWRVRLRGAVTATPRLIGQDLIVSTDQGRLYAINPVGGKTLWSYRLGGTLTGVYASTYNLLVGTDSGWVYCIKRKQPAPATKEKQ